MNNWEDILKAVIKEWNDKADEYNQWENLGVDEMLELTIKYCMKIPRRTKN